MLMATIEMGITQLHVKVKVMFSEIKHQHKLIYEQPVLYDMIEQIGPQKYT